MPARIAAAHTVSSPAFTLSARSGRSRLSRQITWAITRPPSVTLAVVEGLVGLALFRSVAILNAYRFAVNIR
jgi:hypothetical protein